MVNTQVQLKSGKLLAHDAVVKREGSADGIGDSKRRKVEGEGGKYAIVRENLGRVFVSQRMKNKDTDASDGNRPELFEMDLAAFMGENDKKLSSRKAENEQRFELFSIVLKLGGIVQVIKARKLGVLATKFGARNTETKLIREICTQDLYLCILEMCLMKNGQASRR